MDLVELEERMKKITTFSHRALVNNQQDNSDVSAQYTRKLIKAVKDLEKSYPLLSPQPFDKNGADLEFDQALKNIVSNSQTARAAIRMGRVDLAESHIYVLISTANYLEENYQMRYEENDSEYLN